MADEESIELLNRFRGGDDDAARELFDRYVHRLIGVARNRLSVKLARRVDPEDIVQSAYRSFFRGADDGNYSLEAQWRPVAVTGGDHHQQVTDAGSAASGQQARSGVRREHVRAGREPLASRPSKSHGNPIPRKRRRWRNNSNS